MHAEWVRAAALELRAIGMTPTIAIDRRSEVAKLDGFVGPKR